MKEQFDNAQIFPDVADIVAVEKNKEALHEIIFGPQSFLDEREKTVLRMRYFSGGATDETKEGLVPLESIAKTLGVVTETVRQIEGKALRKIRAHERKHKDQWVGLDELNPNP